MNQEKEKHNKTEIILSLLTELILYGRLSTEYIKSKYNISDKTMYRYIAEIKNMLSNFGHDNVKIKTEKSFSGSSYICTIKRNERMWAWNFR